MEPVPGNKKPTVTNVRLPTHLVPQNYKLELVPFIIPDNFTIRGYVEIEMDCTQSAFNVTLHVADLSIENDTVVVMENNGYKLDVNSISYDLDREFFIVNLNPSLIAGKTYVIKIHYTAYL